MAGASLLTLIDDIATILDDVSLMTKVAVKKTAGVLGDDLALNAQQVSGVKADRELPVVWAVARGSLRNKAILVPAALLISAIAPWAVTPLLMLGGAFLCFEGAEKLFHAFTHDEAESAQEHERLVRTLSDPDADVVALEQDKIKGAVRTDFILSAEIIAITLGSVAGAPFPQQVAVLVGIALIMTVGVYGLVAGIVKLDDLGLYLSQRSAAPVKAVGSAIVRVAPYLMKSLSVIGTAAMFMVGGGILAHGLPAVHHGVEALAHLAADLPSAGTILGPLSETALNAVIGMVAGAAVLAGVKAFGMLRRRRQA
ncbi:DUF808 domain-containing protein [Halomonas heilongjiangensis]|uniref:DUF808 domain-containing protein n=1 Tax=Halomonas heilongjiangensis TaxID=1387883 RepID=A0A2N7TTZ1_9GAMM|nr:DUF808 domain-containing protein [Halomonas heilongjiangensis]PMR71645.1 DUF808 domain-containing protein [Halomonas heilongjiangensis]PXX87212.1 hypothetical protein CR158_19480 [Halomonas heilongjiangensis]